MLSDSGGGWGAGSLPAVHWLRPLLPPLQAAVFSLSAEHQIVVAHSCGHSFLACLPCLFAVSVASSHKLRLQEHMAHLHMQEQHATQYIRLTTGQIALLQICITQGAVSLMGA